MNKIVKLDHVWHLIKQNRRFMMLITFALAVFYPLPLWLTLQGSTGQYEIIFTGYKIAELIGFYIIAASIPLVVFRYMTSKKELDVYHSLPIKKEALYVTNFLAAMFIAYIPLIVSWTFGIIVQVAYGYDVNFLIELGELAIVFAFLPIIMFAAMFAINNIGTIFDSFVYTVLIQVLPFIVMFVLQLYGDQYLYASNSILTPQLNSFISPQISFVSSVLFRSKDFVFYWSYLLWPLLGWILILFNRRLYASRKVENVESPIMNSWFNPLITYIITVLVLLLALYTYNFTGSGDFIEFMYPVMTVLVFYLFMDAISHRGFSHFFKGIIEFAVILAVSIAILFGLKSANGFGFDHIIPEANEVKQVKISTYDNLIFTPQYVNSNWDGAQYVQYPYYEVYSDQKDVEHVVDFHHYIVNTYYEFFKTKQQFDETIYQYTIHNSSYVVNYETNFESRFKENGVDVYDIYADSMYWEGNPKDYFGPTTTLQLQYTYKSGRKLTRTYTVPVEWTYDLYLLATE